MKTLPAGMQTHLDTGATTLAWCWRLTRTDSVVLGFTDHDRTLTFDGTDFEAEAGFSAAEIAGGTDLAVDAQDATGVLTSDRITETDILDGRWDNATVEIWRVNWSEVAQRLLMRVGTVGHLRRGRVAFTAEMRSLAAQLGQTVGRVYQQGCDARLGDTRCGVNTAAAAFAGSGTVTDVLRDRAFVASGLSGFASAWFALGELTWTLGANSGRLADVLLHDLSGGVVTLTLLDAPLRGVDVDDTFTVVAGCDKRFSTCGTKFANTARFRGFPTIPGQDALIRSVRPELPTQRRGK